MVSSVQVEIIPEPGRNSTGVKMHVYPSNVDLCINNQWLSVTLTLTCLLFLVFHLYKFEAGLVAHLADCLLLLNVLFLPHHNLSLFS